MDKDVLRIIILIIGLLVVAGMIAWSFFKHEKAKQEFDEFDVLNNENTSPISEINIANDNDAPEIEEDDIKPQKESKKVITPPNFKTQKKKSPSENIAKIDLPPVLQFILMAPEGEDFNGLELVDVLKNVKLEYGTLQIFERLDKRRLVDFGVANMVKPGTFPSDNLADFYSPGIVFFMQPSNVDDPISVYEDFVRTFNFVALKLNGIMLDHQREPLTNETIEAIRQSL